MWFLSIVDMVEAGLRPLTDDNGAMQTINIANQHGNVHLYVLHPIYVGEAIECIDCVPADQENNIGPVADNSLGQQNNGPVAENGAVVDDSIQVDDNGPDSNIGPVDHSGNCGSINVNKDKGKKILVENQRDNDTESDDIARNVIFYDSEEEDMVMKDLWLVDMDLWLVMMDLCL
ncbi:hypothetical protein D0Y65_004977 [Glycine soja]|uniref:Uncharacterized protein n=1 Tax=Glycine soja TaxID=3848 RepID=A0A445LTP9_GLYSO|nr:hypothetical protein D0Y65_004977 [Glycine soja]RZC26589.1 hypothetical protein D0Y65_004977 [Glycine soja]